jgi:hypothetical protein
MHAHRDRGAVRMPEWVVVLTGSVLVAFAAFFAAAVWRELPRKRPRVTLLVNPRRSSMDAPEVRSAVDSPLERRRFDPSVPPGHNLSAVGKMLRHPRSRKSGSQEIRSWRKLDANLRPLRGPKMNPAQPETRKYRS